MLLLIVSSSLGKNEKLLNMYIGMNIQEKFPQKQIKDVRDPCLGQFQTFNPSEFLQGQNHFASFYNCKKSYTEMGFEASALRTA